MAGEIGSDLHLEAVAGEQRGHCLNLVEADLDRRKSAWLEQTRELRRERAICVEPLLAGEQGLVGLILAHAWAELGAFGDVGRVAQDEIEAVLDPFSPIAELPMRARLEAEAARI